MPQLFSIGPFEVKAIGPHKPIAEVMLDLHRRHPRRSSYHFGGSQLGGVNIEGAYNYPPVAVADQTDGQVSGKK